MKWPTQTWKNDPSTHGGPSYSVIVLSTRSLQRLVETLTATTKLSGVTIHLLLFLPPSATCWHKRWHVPSWGSPSSFQRCFLWSIWSMTWFISGSLTYSCWLGTSSSCHFGWWWYRRLESTFPPTSFFQTKLSAHRTQPRLLLVGFLFVSVCLCISITGVPGTRAVRNVPRCLERKKFHQPGSAASLRTLGNRISYKPLPVPRPLLTESD